MAESRQATLADVSALFTDLSAVTVEEFSRIGVCPDALKPLVEKNVAEGIAYTVADRDGPLFILGIRPEADALYTWFVASRRSFEAYAQMVFAGRALLQFISRNFPAYYIVSQTFSRRPQTRRWFKLLGFELIDDKQDFLVFRYQREPVAKGM